MGVSSLVSSSFSKKLLHHAGYKDMDHPLETNRTLLLGEGIVKLCKASTLNEISLFYSKKKYISN